MNEQNKPVGADRDEVCFAGVAAQAQLLRSGELSARELVSACLARIDRYDGQLNAFRKVFAEEALVKAAQADERLARGDRAPLLGVPVAVKEDLPLAGQPTTNGTRAVTTLAEHDSETIARLRAAGAIVVGRTRAPELCLPPYTESGFAGPTRNPWSLDRTCGGSSGGSAVAVAAGLVGAALGSDGGGSIRIPAAWCGVFGLKPQTGRISYHPLRNVWHGLAVPGPLTATVRDWALLADQLHGQGPDDAALADPGSFTDALNQAPKPLRIAVSAQPWVPGVVVSPEVSQSLTDAANLLAQLGHRTFDRDPRQLPQVERKAFSSRFLRSAADGQARLDHPNRLDRRTRQLAALGRLVSDRAVAKARAYGTAVGDAANEIFADADLLLTPVVPRVAPPLAELRDYGFLRASLAEWPKVISFTMIWNIAGNPAAAVPVGWTPEGLPLSVQLVGRRGDEHTVLTVAAQLEESCTPADRRPPLR